MLPYDTTAVHQRACLHATANARDGQGQRDLDTNCFDSSTFWASSFLQGNKSTTL